MRIRIAPELDTAHPELRKAVESSGVGVVAEPAEFELGTDRYLPDFSELAPLAGSSDIFKNQSVFRLGKLSSGDVPKVLTSVLTLMTRQKVLQLLPSPPPNQITFCKADLQKPGTCITADMSGSAGEISSSIVRNRGDRPKYVALLQTSANLGIDLAPIAASEAMARIDPGQTISIPAFATDTRGRIQEYLLISDQPFDGTSFTQPSPFKAGPSCYGQIRPECLSPVVAAMPPAGTTALPYTSYGSDEPQPAMGGGFPAGPGDADWMVAIYSTVAYTAQEIADDAKLPDDKRQFLAERTADERAHSCGGTMIAPDLVLTAAHCVATGRFKRPNEARVFTDRRVRIGSRRLGKGGETRAIVGVAIHAGYTGERSGIPFDIALLKVKSDDRIRLNPLPLDLATKGPSPGSTVVGLGWGFTKSVAPNSNILMSTTDELQRNPNLLQQAPLQVLGTPNCRTRLKEQLKPGMICLVTPTSVSERGGAPTFSCRGDSGGPLVRDYGQGGAELVGLTSWSRGCGYKDTPSVYTDVAYFAKWIAAARAEIKAGRVSWVADPARR